jgi:hypothetical protein
MKKLLTKGAGRPAGLPQKLVFAGIAMILGCGALPRPGQAQGIVRGAQEGAYEGNRVAGPVGGVVGGAVGAVEGVLGVPHRSFRHHYRCRGYYDSYGDYHCFR